MREGVVKIRQLSLCRPLVVTFHRVMDANKVRLLTTTTMKSRLKRLDYRRSAYKKRGLGAEVPLTRVNTGKQRKQRVGFKIF